MTTTDSQLPVSFDINKERDQYDILISQWDEEKTKVKTRRSIRENRRNVMEERQRKTILEDETIIPDRTINTNIKRGRVPYLNYITQSKRLLILTDVDDPKKSTESIELWFTRGARFPRWKYPWIKSVDCMLTHGGCAMEIVYDPSKPLNFSIEYIPRESLIFQKETKTDLQSSPRLLRCYEITTLQLEEFTAEFSFVEAVSKRIADRFKDNTKFIKIYRVLFKRSGIVYNAWYSPDENTEWLRAPMPHNIGLFEFDRREIAQVYNTPEWDMLRLQLSSPLPLKLYPVFWFPFDVTEDEVLLNTQGRVALDIHVQESLTQLLTNVVNCTTRASRFYPTAEGEPGNDSKLMELGPLKPGVVMSGKITTFQPEWPNNIILAVTQVLDQRKAQESGNVDFAALARKDANKTATEMNLATEQSSQLNQTDLDVYSSPFLDVYALCFEIARQQAIWKLCKPPQDTSLLFNDYHVTPAGDVEVVKRSEDRQNAKEFFNLVRGTPLAEKVFAMLIEHFFPDQAAEWKAILQAPDKDQIIAQLVSILQQIPTDELTPEQRTSLQAVIISAQNVVGGGSNTEATQGTLGPAPGASSSGIEAQQTITN
jgi:hypothetical protein